MIKGNIDNFKGKGLVGFLDILGFSKEIESHWNDKDENPLEKILELKEHIPVRSKYDFDKSEEENKTLKYVCRVQTISDSIVVSFGFDEPIIYGDLILGIISFFDTISVIWRNSLEAGFTLRGAVDFGQIYWDEKEIIGPSFIKTYKLEQQFAKTSRVIVSSEFNQHLLRIFTGQTTFWNKIILEVLRKDSDGYLILNPHTLYSRKDEEENEDKIHIVSLIKKLRDGAKGMNREKYAPLLAALDSDKYNLKKEDLGKY